MDIRPPRARSRWLLVTLLALLSLVAFACGSDSDDGEVSTAAGDAAADAGASDGAPAEDGLVAATTTGGQLAFNDLQGSPTLLWFWAPW